MKMETEIQRAARAVRQATALVIGAGAGMGVDSGLPDFRGTKGFWKAYPVFAKLGLSFMEMANPQWFATDPALAWGFYGHRLHLYRATIPHDGFFILRRWAKDMKHGAFVFTSNVDGQFQRAGFSAQQVVECHGSIHYLQCVRPCGSAIWEASAERVAVNRENLRAAAPWPRCPHCGGMARPNILMFGDGSWRSERATRQRMAWERWLQALRGTPTVVVELGAGTAVPAVRWTCERTADWLGTRLVRINPRESRVPAGHIGLPLGALAGLQRIDEAIARDGVGA